MTIVDDPDVGQLAPAAAGRGPQRRSDLPQPLAYRVKNRLLGPPLHNESLAHERLGKPTALAVFASDNLSSCAYATEEILRVLVPVVGLAAFTLVTPITGALLVVLGFLILSYRQTIKAYPSAGGAYIVTRDNFGLMAAQVAGVALLTDYVLTVSVSVAAGTDAMASALPAIGPYKLWIAIGLVVLIATVNLRGVKESGKLFAVPTYFFIVNMGLLLGSGLFRLLFTELPKGPTAADGMVPIGSSSGNGLLLGASVFIVLKAFGSGGAAVTGVEAISNGVPAFKDPSWKNARQTLVVMGSLLGVMFLGLSVLAAKTRAMPYAEGNPTVISQVGKLVYGQSPAGHLCFYMLQVGTMLILVLAANTSFADFPRLASFHAGDNFMPRQFMVRGHRLVFSNGIIFLAGAGALTLLATGGKVSRLIPLYAIGVFTSFTLSQAGMAKHHIRHREPQWRTGLVINGIGALLSLIVLAIVAAVKFTEGAWAIIVLVPILVLCLVRLNKAYETEEQELEHDAAQLASTPGMRRHAVILLVDNLDVAAARALQYARTLTPDDLRAVHFDMDPWKTKLLTDAWMELGLSRFPLEVVECSDRRMSRGVLELVDSVLADGQTEVSVLIPRREYTKLWHRLLHDRSSRSIIATISSLPHCNVTVVPYHLGRHESDSARCPDLARPVSSTNGAAAPSPVRQASLRYVAVAGLPDDRTSIHDLPVRAHAKVAGRVKSIRVQPWGGNPTLECTLVDESGSVMVVFFGRRQVPGIRPGTVLAVEGVAGRHRQHTAFLNPAYTIISAPPEPSGPHEH